MSALIDFEAVLAAAERLQAELDFPNCTCRAADGCATWVACRCLDCSTPGKGGTPQGFRAREDRGHFDRLLPCRHVRAASKAAREGAFPAADLGEVEWLAYIRGVADLFALADPATYAEPPKCLAAAEKRLRRRSRINVYLLRHKAGAGLYHDDDPWRKKGERVLRVTTTSPGRGGNGVRLISEALCLVSRDCRKQPDPWPYQQTPPRLDCPTCAASFPEGTTHCRRCEKADKVKTPLAAETPKRREWRERDNRVNRMLVQLQKTGEVDYSTVYPTAAEGGAA